MAKRSRMRRAFALPVIILLVLVGGIMSAVLLERLSAQNLIVRRQVEHYRSKHFERGVREVVGEWTGSLFGQPLAKLAGEDGHALDLVLPDRSTASVYLFDAQGSVLSEPQGLTNEQREDGAGVTRELWALSGNDPDPAWFRPVGPLQVSAMSAEPEVLRAIARHAGGTGDRFASTLLAARQAGELQMADLERAITDEGLSPEQGQAIHRLVAIKPDLWGVVVEVKSPRGEVQARYAGRFTLPGDGSRGMGSLQTLGKFLSWEELPL